jgi:hypothetical protein
LVRHFFNYGSPQFNYLVESIRKKIFQEVASSELPGIIFTFVWAFNEKADGMFIDECSKFFVERGGECYFVELQAHIDKRLERNKTEWRLLHKPDKRNLQYSKQNLLESDSKYELRSPPKFFEGKNYLFIDNTNLSAEETAALIARKFSLK